MIAKRIPGVEVLRVFAIFMVVLIHSTPGNGANLLI